MNPRIVLQIARREFRANVSSYAVYLLALIYFGLTLGVTRLAAPETETEALPDRNALLLSLIHLQMYMAPLMALVLSYDGILSEHERGMLGLMRSYPLRFADIVVGKWLGYAAVTSIAIIAGLIPAAGTLTQIGIDALDILGMFAASVALGLSFLSIGLLLSSLSTDRTRVIIGAIGLWIFFVFLFDLGVVVLLTSTDGQIPDNVIRGVMFLNPAELFRIHSIVRQLDAEAVAYFGLGAGVLGTGWSAAGLIAWIVGPLGVVFFGPFRAMSR